MHEESEEELEINSILLSLEHWNQIFRAKKEFYIDGYCLFFEEQNIYPRLISMYKSYETKEFSICSYKRIFDLEKCEDSFQKLYSVNGINNIQDLTNKLKEIFYGKDLLNQAMLKINIFK